MPDPERSAESSEERASASLIERVLAEFKQALREGDNPSIEDYAERYPELAELIRDVLPAMNVLEAAREGRQPEGGSTLAGGDKGSLPELSDLEIKQKIGQGGMGVVYLAWQQSLNRFVAVKIFPNSGQVNETLRARFQAEARAAATLKHESIVPVFAIGNEFGIDYYVMQYIDGYSVQQLIEHQSSAGETPREYGTTECERSPGESGESSPRREMGTIPHVSPNEELTWQIAARITALIADALAHAHRHGIVHRDVKPSNILVDSNGRAWLADFGLAHVEHDERLTAPGTVLGSLRYMSPEQLEPELNVVDYRADIYGLGVTLYEMVCGTPAIQGDNRQVISQRILAGVIVPPRKLQANLPRDLQTIIQKATRHDANDRYGRADDLAKDLRAVLEHRPIMAKPPSRVDAAFKWAMRNQGIVRVAVVLFLIATTILGVSFWRVSEANRRNSELLVELSASQDATEKSLQTARVAIINFNVNTLDALQLIPNTLEIREKLLERSLEYCNYLVDTKANPTMSAMDLAIVKSQIGTLNFRMMRLDDAELAVNEAIEIVNRDVFGRRAVSHSELFEQAGFYALLASIHIKQRDWPASLQALDRSEALIRNIMESHPRDWPAGELLVSCYMLRAEIHRNAGDLKKAEGLLRDSIDLAQKLRGIDAEDFTISIRVIESTLELAEILIGRRDLQTSGDMLTSIEPELEKLREKTGDILHIRTASARIHEMRGNINLLKREYSQAEVELTIALNEVRKITEGFPDLPALQYHRASNALLLMEISRSKGDDSEAEKLREEAKQAIGELEDQELLSQENMTDIGGTYHTLAMVALENRDFEMAEQYVAEAKELTSRSLAIEVFRTNSRFMSNHEYLLARIFADQNRIPEAIDQLELAAKWRRTYFELVPADDVERVTYGEIYFIWTRLLSKLKRDGEAMEIGKQALAICDEMLKQGVAVEVNRERKANLLWGLSDMAFFAGRIDDFEKFTKDRIQFVRENAGRPNSVSLEQVRGHLSFLIKEASSASDDLDGVRAKAKEILKTELSQE